MYEFTKLELNRDEFDNLMFMGPPTHERDKIEDKWLLSLCNRPIKEVAQEVIEKSTCGLSYTKKSIYPRSYTRNALTPSKIFGGINIRSNQYNNELWFKRHVLLSKHFDKDLMDTIWIRNLSHWGSPDDEKHKQPNCSFYITDGNHRALVYAVFLECKKLDYEPVKVLHATSWAIASGILGWQGWEKRSALECEGEILPKGGHEFVEKNSFRMLANGETVDILVKKRVSSPQPSA